MMQSARFQGDSQRGFVILDIVICLAVLFTVVACYLIPLGIAIIGYRVFCAVRDARDKLKIVAKSLT